MKEDADRAIKVLLEGLWGLGKPFNVPTNKLYHLISVLGEAIKKINEGEITAEETMEKIRNFQNFR